MKKKSKEDKGRGSGRVKGQKIFNGDRKVGSFRIVPPRKGKWKKYLNNVNTKD